MWFALPAGDLLAGVLDGHGTFAVAISVASFALLPGISGALNLFNARAHAPRLCASAVPGTPD